MTGVTKKARTQPLIDDIPIDEDRIDRIIELLEAIEFHLSVMNGFTCVGVTNEGLN